jgi:membrane protease YdiL (CAAX protease family)
MNIDDDKSFPPEAPEGSSAGHDSAPRSDGSSSEISHELSPAPVQESAAAAVSLIPDDLRVPWSWIDVLAFILLYLVGWFFVGIFVTMGFAAFGITLQHIQKSVTQQSLFSLLAQAILDFGVFAYLVAQVRLQFGRPFWRTIGWRPLETGKTPRALAYLGLLFGGFILAMMITLASAVSPPKVKMPIQSFLQNRQSAFFFILMGVLLAPLIEETLFRGYLYPVIARSFSVSAGVLVTGTLFGLLHAQQLWGGWLQIGLLVVVGIVLTFARAATKTVVASYLLHLSYNSYQLISFVVASHGLRHLPLPQ